MANDRSPSPWEIPGGAVDDDDESILHAVARELWEESGLVAASIRPVVGDPHLFVSMSSRHIEEFFLVDIEVLEVVKLSPTETSSGLEEVKAKKVGNINLEFTTTDLETTVLEAFKMRRSIN